MAESFLASAQKQRQVREGFVASGGNWRKLNETLVAVNGTWKSGFSSRPRTSLTVTKSTDAPWSRITYSYTATGSWKTVEVALVTPGPKYEVLYLDKVAASNVTVTLPSKETGVLIPGTKYTVILRYVPENADPLTSPINLESVDITLDGVPKITGMVVSGITHNAFSVNWANPRDVTDYTSRNDTMGTSWPHGGAKPYIDYAAGTATPDTTHKVYTKAKVGTVEGPWSDVVTVKTLAVPYIKGAYTFSPNSDSDTYQSGGSMGTYWQDQRSGYYGGNGGAWGSTRGVQRTAFFYTRDTNMANAKTALDAGATIKSAQVYVKRGSGNGYGSAKPVPIALHQTSTAKTAGPSNSSGNQYLGALASNQEGWMTVPTWWAGHIIKGEHTGWLFGDANSAEYYTEYVGASGMFQVVIE